MGLKKAGGNMYAIVSHTWNAIKGKCFHDCSYCYMKRWRKQNPVHFDERELKTYLYTPGYKRNIIFVGSSCDMFADDIPDEWIKKVMNHIRQYPYNKYLLQSKNPKRIVNFLCPADTNFILCTTLETNRFYPSIMRNVPAPKERADVFKNLHPLREPRIPLYITIEPILDFDTEEFVSMLYDLPVSLVHIGADSCHHHLPEPPKEKILDFIGRLERFTDVVCKPNLNRIIGKKGGKNG